MKTKRFICGALLAVAMLFAESASAQLKTSYFMEGSYFRTELNPALAPTRGYISLPFLSGFMFGEYSNYKSYENMYYKGENGYISALHSSVPANEFLSKLPNKCVDNFNGSLNLFKLGFYTINGSFINFGANVRIDYTSAIPKEYYKMLKGAYQNSIDINNMNVDLSAYLESYAGLSFPINDNLTIGARFKFLIGLVNGRFDVNNMQVNNGKYTAHGTLIFNSVEYDSSKYDGQTNPEIIVNETQEFVWNNLHSFGGAIDLGAEMRFLDNQVKVSAAITDLGFIRWSADTQVRGTATVDSNDVTDLMGLLSDINMDIPDKFSDYATRLTTNVNIGAEYNFCSNHFAVGLLSHTRLYRKAVATELTTSFNWRPTNWMTFTASHTFLNGNTPGIYGAAINIHPRAINFFIGMDYIGDGNNTTDFEPTTMSEIDRMFSPKATSYNFIIGVGFNFGRPDFLVEQ